MVNLPLALIGGVAATLAVGGGEPGKEIRAPLAQVVLGGLLTSTLLNMVVLPALFFRWGLAGDAETLSLSGRVTFDTGDG